MIGLIQRVSSASVEVDDKIIGAIDRGILAFIGIEKHDTESQAKRMLDRILSYRIFEDANEKMNLNIKDIQGGLLLVSQFTLVADTKSGTRPGFSTAMHPSKSHILFEYLTTLAKQKHSATAMGEFGAFMKISLCNEGPATFILRT